MTTYYCMQPHQQSIYTKRALHQQSMKPPLLVEILSGYLN